MPEFLMEYYLWLKALHIIAVISWMAGMLYLPRLFVYHAQSQTGSAQSETFKTMEYRLMRYIMTPASIATWLFGGLMLYANWGGLMSGAGWMHAKLLLVVLMTGVHHVFIKWRKQFAADKNMHSSKFYRYWNEVPTVLMIAVVILVVVKPF